MDLDEVCQRFQCQPLHRRLRSLREEVGTSQEQLAKYLGMQQSTISRMESGGDALISTWMKVLAGLGCDLTIRSSGGWDDREYHEEESARRRANRHKGLAPNWEYGRRR